MSRGACIWYLVYLFVFRYGFVVGLFGQVFFERHGLQDAVVPLQCWLSVSALYILDKIERMTISTWIRVLLWVVLCLGKLKLLNDYPHHIH